MVSVSLHNVIHDSTFTGVAVIALFFDFMQDISSHPPSSTYFWTDALEDHEGNVSIGGRAINNLRFADDIDGLAGEEEELAKLVEHLDKAFIAYGMEISAEKTKLMTSNASGINTEIKWTEA